MSDRPSSNDPEDMLTGRRAKRPAARNQDQAKAPGTQPRTGRSRRKFTVDALFSDTRPQALGVRDLAEAKEIALERIIADPDQPRRTFDAERLAELAASIGKEGVLQPIVVRYDSDADRYIIVHGERRFRASGQAGLTTIPALVRNVPEGRRLIQQLMENIVRDDLNAVDRARALHILKNQMNDAPWEDVAAEVGIRRSRLFQLLDTGKLPGSAQNRIRSGTLSEKQSRALQGLPPVYQQALADAITERAVAASIATRVSRAVRQSARQETTPAAARHHVDELLNLALGGDEDARSAQSDRLLAALHATLLTTADDRGELDEIATALGAPRFSDERVTKAVGELARTLARADAGAIADDQALRQRLRSLADVINRLTEQVP